MKKCYATIHVGLHDMDHNIDLNYCRKIRPVTLVNNFVVVGFMCWDCSTWRFCPSSHFCMTQNVWQKTKMSRINYEQRIMPILLTQWRGCFQPLHNICNCSYLMYFERNPLCNISNNLAQKRKTKSWEKTVSEISL